MSFIDADGVIHLTRRSPEEMAAYYSLRFGEWLVQKKELEAEIVRLRAGLRGLRRGHGRECLSRHDRHCACGATEWNRAIDALLEGTHV